MALLVLRAFFFLIAASLAVTIMNSALFQHYNDQPWFPWLVFSAVMLAAGIVVALDVWIRPKRIDAIASVYFGLLIGLLLTYVIGIAMQPLINGVLVVYDDSYRVLAKSIIQLALGIVLCYTCTSFLLQTKDDFRFVIPYVEFTREVKGLRPFILDTSAIIDGRIADVAETQILDNRLIMPRFVLAELQNIADSSDKQRRARGRRGLDVLQRLRTSQLVDFQIHERELPEMAGQEVDMKLVLLAKNMGGKLITGDYNLNKVAKLQNVPVVNLNDLSNALKPVFLPGERVAVRLVRQGEEEGQGVGYLDDGTMIVVEGGRPHVGKEVRIAVTSVLQTSAGRMIFGKYEDLIDRTAPS